MQIKRKRKSKSGAKLLVTKNDAIDYFVERGKKSLNDLVVACLSVVFFPVLVTCLE